MTNKAAKSDIICGLILCAQKRKIASLEQCTRPIFYICGMIQRTHNKPNVYYVYIISFNLLISISCSDPVESR